MDIRKWHKPTAHRPAAVPPEKGKDMTLKKFEKMGFAIGKKFEVNGKEYLVQSTRNSWSTFYLRCLTDEKTLVTRGSLGTCYNKILENSR